MNAFEKIKDRTQYQEGDMAVSPDAEPADSSYEREATAREKSETSKEIQMPGLDEPRDDLPELSPAERAAAYEAQPDIPEKISNEWMQMLVRDTQVMFEFALKNSKPIDPEIHARMHSGKVSDLLRVYRNLSDVIRPATAASITYIQSAAHKKYFISPFSIVKDLVILGMLSIIVFIGVSVSPYVNEQDLNKGVLHNSGLEMLHSLVFICATACLGAIFSISIQVVRKLSTYTLTLTDTHYFKSLIVLGIISGLIMSELMGMDVSNQQTGVMNSKMTMALLGGTASEILYIILNILMNKIRNMISQI